MQKYSYGTGEITTYKNYRILLVKHCSWVSSEQSSLFVDVIKLVENEAHDLDSCIVPVLQTNMLLVLIITSKAKIMKLRLFDSL